MSNWALGGVAAAVERRMAQWEAEDVGRRLWAKDPTLWFPTERPEIANRLGWLELPQTLAGQVRELRDFADSLSDVAHVVLLGMGGSSLAPEVFQRTLGSGRPELIVLDSTHPDAVRQLNEQVNPTESLFVVSSKSGGTLETLSFFRYFWERTGGDGSRFIAITDPGSSLETLARERRFKRVFLAPPDVGGRYSALSVFGLVPAALIGIDLDRLVDSAAEMATANSAATPVADNSALRHGAVLGEFALAGFDKLTYLVSPSLAAFPDWLEQLVAESTGKDGTGIVPIAAEPTGDASVYGNDRLFVSYEYAGDDLSDHHRAIGDLERAGHPVIRFPIDDLHELGAEMFRAEVAVAAAGAVMGIHPFDQPDVQLAKELTIRAMAGEEPGAPLPEWRVDDLDRINGGEVRPGDYVALQAFLPHTPAANELLGRIRVAYRDRIGAHPATTLGFGPRFLHSTGQLHKGGPDSVLAVQLVDDVAEDLPVPETDYTFGDLVRAQALGDAQALASRGKRVLRINLGADPESGLEAIISHLER